jgi:ABC-type nitrate/sulfonate/bicarbonate transport system substrate-binding protein
MKKIINPAMCLLLTIISVFPLYAYAQAEDFSAMRVIRIAYPKEIQINSHIGQVLLRTNILKKNGLNGRITGIIYGGSIMKAMGSDEIDVAFTSEFPTVKALGNGLPATIIATIGSLGRVGIIVLADSQIFSTRDLKNKKIGVMFDSTPYHALLIMLKTSGLVPGEDVTVLNIERSKLGRVLLEKEVDAIATLEPGVEYFIQKKQCRLIQDRQYFSVVIMRNSFIEKNLPDAVNFINALKEAAFFMGTHKDLVNKWFVEVTGFDLDPQILKNAVRFNSNYSKVKEISDVDIALNDNFLKMLVESAEFIAAEQVNPKAVDINKAVNPQLKAQAGIKIRKNSYNVSAVEMINK